MSAEERIHRPGGERFTWGDILDANTVCGVRPKKQITERCPECKRPVFLHCNDCKIQVTGCLCTDKDRRGEESRLEEALTEEERIQRARRLRRTGLWIPGREG